MSIAPILIALAFDLRPRFAKTNPLVPSEPWKRGGSCASVPASNTKKKR